MSTFTVQRLATPDEIAAEMDRRGEVIEKLETNLRHWREECGKVHARLSIAEARADALSVQVVRLTNALKASRGPIVGLIYNVETWGLTQRLALIDAALTDPAEKPDV